MRMGRMSGLRARLLVLVILAVVPAFVAVALTARTSVEQDLIDVGVAAVLVLVAAWIAGETFVLRRVRALVEAAGRLAGGDLSARSGLPYGLGEIGAVARAFDEMAEQLERRDADARAAEERRRASEERYRELFENANDVVFTHDLEGRLMSINRAAERVMGSSAGELVGRNWAEVVVPEHRELVVQMIERTVERGDATSYQVDALRTDGHPVSLEVRSRLICEEGRPAAVQAIARDVTDRKRADENLRRSVEALRRSNEERRHLLSHLSQVQERERSRIAGEIHDDSIQVMTAIGIRLGQLRRMLDQADELEVVNDVEANVSLAIARLRALLFDLRPPVLERDGLAPALRLCLEQLAADKDLAFELENRVTREPSPETRAVLYRIAREALANVRRHAGAGHVTVTLAERNRGFLVRVRDDGRGLPISALRAQASGAFGLDEMRERDELAGGWWKAHNDPGGGTVIEFWVPVEMQRDPPAA